MLCFSFVGCRESETPLPALYTSMGNAVFDDFIYTNNEYLLTFKNNRKNAKHFALSLKSNRQGRPIQPVFPLSKRDSLFASNLIYALVGKEGETWMLFDKSDQKLDAPKRYKLIKYDLLSRTVVKTYFVLPIQGRTFSHINDLQIDETNGMMFYIDTKKKDIVSLNLEDGTFKAFTLPAKNTANPILESIHVKDKDTAVSKNPAYRIALNRQRGQLYILDYKHGELYTVKESYLKDKRFYRLDIQSQIVRSESELTDVVDIEFDSKSRPVIATKSSILIVRDNDKTYLVKNFKYGDITAMSCTNDKVFFSAFSSKFNIYSIAIAK